MTVDVERFRTQLQEERSRVVAVLENLRRENSDSMGDEAEESSVGNHMADTASLTFDREMDYSLEENEVRVLEAIDAALVRIEDGTYGRCERCGKEIEEERLVAIPYATLCIDDKRRDERG
jgi:RNA polymerase-binding protein DksA